MQTVQTCQTKSVGSSTCFWHAGFVHAIASNCKTMQILKHFCVLKSGAELYTQPSEWSQDAQAVSQTCTEGSTEMGVSLKHIGQDNKLIDRLINC